MTSCQIFAPPSWELIARCGITGWFYLLAECSLCVCQLKGIDVIGGGLVIFILEASDIVGVIFLEVHTGKSDIRGGVQCRCREVVAPVSVCVVVFDVDHSADVWVCVFVYYQKFIAIVVVQAKNFDSCWSAWSYVDSLYLGIVSEGVNGKEKSVIDGSWCEGGRCAEDGLVRGG